MNKIKSALELAMWALFGFAILGCVSIVEVIGGYATTFHYLLIAALLTLLFWPLLKLNRSRLRFWLYSVYMCALLGIYCISWTSRKYFLRDLYSIQIGMTVWQVENMMSRYHQFDLYEQTIPTNPAIISYRHADANDGWYNGDYGYVYFRNGRVTKVEFSPD